MTNQRQSSAVTLMIKRQLYSVMLGFNVYLDGQKTASIGNGKSIDLLVLPGPHTLQIRQAWSESDCSGNQSYFSYNAVGSVSDLTNGAGTVTDTYVYDVFDAITSHSGPSTNYWLFTGEQLDGATGDTSYYFLRARYYDPSLGRFIGRDRMQFEQRYVYASNNPLLFVDPSGLCRLEGLLTCLKDGLVDSVKKSVTQLWDYGSKWINDPANQASLIQSGATACALSGFDPIVCGLAGALFVVGTALRLEALREKVLSGELSACEAWIDAVGTTAAALLLDLPASVVASFASTYLDTPICDTATDWIDK